MLAGTLAVGCTVSSPDTSVAAAPADPTPATDEGRVVAVGDLHGDLDNALSALRLAGVVDEDGHWSGGQTTLVQTGDLTDRGPDSRALLDLFQRLQREAPKTGGRVVALLGNHEVMNLTGDWRYVHPGDIAAFGGEQARREALAADGTYGAWLTSLPVAADVQGTVFVHGGLKPELTAGGLDGVNEGVRQSLMGQAAPEIQRALLGPDGPLWYRGYVNAPEAEACAELKTALDRLGARRMVVGHTTRRDGRIASRCDGKLQIIDIGIADGYGGHLGVWVSDAGDARAVYPSGPVDLEDPA